MRNGCHALSLSRLGGEAREVIEEFLASSFRNPVGMVALKIDEGVRHLADIACDES